MMTRTYLYEVTIEVRQLVVKLLFNDAPTIKDVCESIKIVFAKYEHIDIRDGMIKLLSEISIDKLAVGDKIEFKETFQPIGFIDLQTRTLFQISSILET